MRFNYDLSGNLNRLSASNAPFAKIIGQPANCVVEPGGTASFSVVVDDLHLVGFQWKFNGTNIPGATRDTLLITNVSDANEGEYTVVVRKGSTSVTSKPTALLLDNKPKGTTSLPPRLVAYSDEGGSVKVSPMKLSYSPGEAVTLTATPFAQSLFAGWMGDLSGMSNPATVTMNANKTVRARFVSAVQPPPGLLAVWRGETDANDSISGHHGTFQVGENVAAPRLTAEGKVGGAFDFDGQMHVRVPDSAALKPAQFTIELWVFPNVLVPATTTQTLIARASTMNRNAWVLELTDGMFHFWTNMPLGADNMPAQSLPRPVAPLNTWTHLAASFDGTTKRLYVNGFEARPRGVQGAIVYEPGTWPVIIGADLRNNIVRSFFRGRIDEVSIYNRALTADEIYSIYSADRAGKNFTQPYFTSTSQWPDAALGVEYTQQVTTLLGADPVSFSLSAGALPPGMTLSPTGVASGVPNASGLFDFTVLAVDVAGASTEQPCLLRVV